MNYYPTKKQHRLVTFEIMSNKFHVTQPLAIDNLKVYRETKILGLLVFKWSNESTHGWAMCQKQQNARDLKITSGLVHLGPSWGLKTNKQIRTSRSHVQCKKL